MIFEQEIINKLSDVNLKASLADTSQLDREIYISDIPEDIYNKQELELQEQITRLTKKHILHLKKFTAKESTRKYILFITRKREDTISITEKDKINLFNHQLTLDRKQPKTVPLNRGTHNPVQPSSRPFNIADHNFPRLPPPNGAPPPPRPPQMPGPPDPMRFLPPGVGTAYLIQAISAASAQLSFGNPGFYNHCFNVFLKFNGYPPFEVVRQLAETSAHLYQQSYHKYQPLPNLTSFPPNVAPFPYTTPHIPPTHPLMTPPFTTAPSQPPSSRLPNSSISTPPPASTPPPMPLPQIPVTSPPTSTSQPITPISTSPPASSHSPMTTTCTSTTTNPPSTCTSTTTSPSSTSTNLLSTSTNPSPTKYTSTTPTTSNSKPSSAVLSKKSKSKTVNKTPICSVIPPYPHYHTRSSNLPIFQAYTSPFIHQNTNFTTAY